MIVVGRKSASVSSAKFPVHTRVCVRSFASVKPGYNYTKTHEWVKVDGKTATVGITDYAQHSLGEMAYVEVSAAVGSSLKPGQSFGTVESVKAASDVYSPISGEVIEVNKAPSKNPGLLNTSPYEEGWLIKLKLTDSGEVAKLLDAKQYEDSLPK
eukprot:TRINITY_DN1783_c0_g1_i1.p1 TRINITY_DN1783_c0_g1~~TRINITY_DN1783_c0_g1_i1.p1  ORF type:complete len:155 (+),score=39.95 TRINITY_DN1783_c0_g1_i1:58-522(+)